MAQVEFPPYGEFALIYNNSVDPNALAPMAWRPNLPLPERESSNLAWRVDTLALLDQTLWPQWDEAVQMWLNGNPARMHALTTADFDLFQRMQPLRLLDTIPHSPVAAASIPTHRGYFTDEDTGKLGDRYYFYDHTLPTAQLEKFATDLRTALKEKTGSVSIQIKRAMQRPRAYQMAKLLGLPHSYELAATSMTASMSSGHCFQGCMLAAGIYESWLARGFAPTTQQVEALEHFGVDIGDRRVFAGVHYPSDNLSSWLLALRLSVEVFTDQRVWKFVADAIQKRSAIYELLKTTGAAPYADALGEVDKLAGHMTAIG